MREEEEESRRRREEARGVKREPVSVCSNRSSRSSTQGYLDFSGCCSFGLESLYLSLSLRPVRRADMGPSLRSGITVGLLLTLAQVIAVSCQEDAEKGK